MSAGYNGNGFLPGKLSRFSWVVFDACSPNVRRWLTERPTQVHFDKPTRITDEVLRRVAIKADEKMAEATLKTYGPDHPQAAGYAERQATVSFIKDLGL